MLLKGYRSYNKKIILSNFINMKHLKDSLRFIEDFPIEGIKFIDISPILKSPPLFHEVVARMIEQMDCPDETLYAGIESRGFIFSSSMALASKKGSVMIRKKGKLPPPTQSISYTLEYGNAEIEISPAAMQDQPLIIVDDVLATGGTLMAAAKLASEAGYRVIGAIVFIDLEGLHEKDLMLPGGQKICSILSM
tara:strand:- start:397 stop:975 length:579 start_codon:yes stop_codon:yes gene_type:complete